MSCTIASTVAGSISGLRPRPGAITPTPATPASMNRSRHAATVFGYVRNNFAVERTERPPANSSNAVACTTLRCGNRDDRAIRSSSTRASGETSMT
jgi:hypothetical protein